MKPQSALIAERMAARHCAELVGGAPASAELGPALALLGLRLARALETGFARLTGGDAPAIVAMAPRDCAMQAIRDEAGGLASHALFAIGAEARTVLASFDAAPVFRLVDRAFGGRGMVPSPLPTAFPLSAELLVARLEMTLAQALGEALEGEAVRPLRRDCDLAQLNAYPGAEAMVQLVLQVQEAGCDAWQLALAFPQSALAGLLAQGPRPSRALAAPRPAPEPAAEPYASLPLTVTAVLVDMTIGFSRLAALRPGDILPVAVARSVPLKIGEQTIATGTIGELDDRLAVRINHAF